MERTWILVADASFCRIFEVSEESPEWSLVKELEHIESREQGHDLRGNRPERVQHREEKAARGSNPIEFKKAEHGKFAHDLAQTLDRDLARNAFDSLVLVAPPQFLGTLRDNLSKNVRATVKAELDKDYTELRPEKVAELVPTF